MSYSSKLSAHYLELAKVSVSKENFAGEDVRFSSEFEALESELAKASSMHESGQIDWLKIRENSESLLRTQSKDLRVGAWLTWALYQRESFLACWPALVFCTTCRKTTGPTFTRSNPAPGPPPLAGWCRSSSRSSPKTLRSRNSCRCSGNCRASGRPRRRLLPTPGR